MRGRGEKWALGLLLAGAALNLAAGARRPLAERAILAQGHYPAADRAAAAVRRHVPPGKPLALVVYAGDMLGELDCGIWADYRLKWLLYPGSHAALRADRDGRVLRPLRYGPPPRAVPDHAQGSATYELSEYVLCFRVTAPPVLPAGPARVLERGEMFVLAAYPK
jgi:hypothetical protein